MATISQTIYWDAFSWMTSFVFWLNFHVSLFLRVQLTIIQHWFRWWLGAVQATSHYLNQCWPDSLMQICGTRGRWVNVCRLDILFVAINRYWLVSYHGPSGDKAKLLNPGNFSNTEKRLSRKNRGYIQSNILTYWGQDRMAANHLMTISDAFFLMKIYKFWLRFHWSSFSWVQLTISQHWFRWWLGSDQVQVIIWTNVG